MSWEKAGLLVATLGPPEIKADPPLTREELRRPIKTLFYAFQARETVKQSPDSGLTRTLAGLFALRPDLAMQNLQTDRIDGERLDHASLPGREPRPVDLDPLGHQAGLESVELLGRVAHGPRGEHGLAGRMPRARRPPRRWPIRRDGAGSSRW